MATTEIHFHPPATAPRYERRRKAHRLIQCPDCLGHFTKKQYSRYHRGHCWLRKLPLFEVTTTYA